MARRIRCAVTLPDALKHQFAKSPLIKRGRYYAEASYFIGLGEVPSTPVAPPVRFRGPR
jgi:hypothetical protein